MKHVYTCTLLTYEQVCIGRYCSCTVRMTAGFACMHKSVSPYITGIAEDVAQMVSFECLKEKCTIHTFISNDSCYFYLLDTTLIFE